MDKKLYFVVLLICIVMILLSTSCSIAKVHQKQTFLTKESQNLEPNNEEGFSIWISPLYYGFGKYVGDVAGIMAFIRNTDDIVIEDVEVRVQVYRGFSSRPLFKLDKYHASVTVDAGHGDTEAGYIIGSDFREGKWFQILHFKFSAESSDGEFFDTCEQTVLSIYIDPLEEYDYLGHMILF